MAQAVMAKIPTKLQAKGKWANLSKYCCRIYFLLIILQVPLFRIQCRSGTCSTPIHVTSSQLISRSFPCTSVPDLQRLEVLAGSYFCVAGSLINIIKPGRMSMFGTLLVVWGLVKEGILKKLVDTDQTTVFVYPTMLVTLVCAFLSVKYDVKKVVRSASAQPVAKPLKSSSKSKLK
ncbi:Unknown protein [Striga hermonthica]|uniref:Uncharacterized protein n=1 Tax=Striga hermonthica TaxID=68872 RepID=A0A9N7RCD5_STRHE|nr:Unknown protein [Striga hermonthica]